MPIVLDEPSEYMITRAGTRYYMSYLANGLRQRIQENGKDKYFLSAEKARAYCITHAKQRYAHLLHEQDV